MEFQEHMDDLKRRTVKGKQCDLCGKRGYHTEGCAGIGTIAAAEPIVAGLKTFWVSMAGDLLGVYIEFQGESKKAVEQYLQRTYLHKSGTWKLPWCAVYDTFPKQPGAVIVKAKCGSVHEEVQR